MSNASAQLRLSVAEGLLLSLGERPTKAVVANARALLEAPDGRATLVLGSAKASRIEAASARKDLRREVARLRSVVEAESKTDIPIDPGAERTLKFVAPARKCRVCGTALVPNALACPKCGADITTRPPTLNLRDGDIPANAAPGGPAAPPARIMMQAAEAPPQPTAKIKSIARPARARARGGRGAGRNTADQSFDAKHPRVVRGRVGGGQFARKGDGMGDEGPSPRVNELQQRLKQLGYDLHEDGKFGPATEAIVRRFQADYGLEPTGNIDAATLETIRRPPPDRVTEVIADKEAADDARKAAAGDSTTLDTSDPAAVRKYQREHGLRVDGIAGPETRAAMEKGGSSSSRSTPSSSGSSSSSPSSRTRGERRRVNIPGIGSVTGDTMKLGVGMGRRADGDVRTIQTLLDDLGFDLGEAGVDGRFGPDTARAVRELQAKYGLVVDGIVGPEVKALLKRVARRHLRARERLDVDALVAEATEKETPVSNVTLDDHLEEAVAARKAATDGAAFARARAREALMRARLAEAQWAHFDSGDGAFHTVICDGCKKSGGLSKVAEVPVNGRMAVEFKCGCGHLTRVLNNSQEYVVPGPSREANVGRPVAEAGIYTAKLHPRDREGQFRDVLGELTAAGRGGGGLTSATRLTPEQKIANFRKMHGRDPSPAQLAKLRGGARPAARRTPKQQERFDAATRRAAGAAQDRHIANENRRIGAEEQAAQLISNFIKMHGRPPSDAQLRVLRKRAGIREAADSLAKASTHKHGLEKKRGDRDNWIERSGPGGKGGQLPAYIQHIALALVKRRGMDRSRAIQMAIGIVKRWAKGVGRVDANTRAAASKAVAEWEGMKAKNRAKKVAEGMTIEEIEEAAERLPARELLECLALSVELSAELSE